MTIHDDTHNENHDNAHNDTPIDNPNDASGNAHNNSHNNIHDECSFDLERSNEMKHGAKMSTAEAAALGAGQPSTQQSTEEPQLQPSSPRPGRSRPQSYREEILSGHGCVPWPPAHAYPLNHSPPPYADLLVEENLSRIPWYQNTERHWALLYLGRNLRTPLQTVKPADQFGHPLFKYDDNNFTDLGFGPGVRLLNAEDETKVRRIVLGFGMSSLAELEERRMRREWYEDTMQKMREADNQKRGDE